jgi:2-oxoglutarate/2-oxoacid ferredoxin oxidoreductase subunit beta
MVDIADYEGLKPAWCPGCGNFGILSAVKKALVELKLNPEQVLMVSGIGQAGKLPHYTRANTLNMLHGRTLPAAAGAKLVNPTLTVIAVGGDGDGYGEGGNHFIHAARRNHDITYLVHDNQIYALTKGQPSPTSDFGFVTGTSPHGSSVSENPVTVAIAAGATFVARGFAGDVDHLSGLIKKGITHRGFSLIDILQPCVSFNHKNTYEWYRERIYKLNDDENYIRDDKIAAFTKALEWGDRIPTGIIYEHDVPSYEQQYKISGSLLPRPALPVNVSGLLADFT